MAFTPGPHTPAVWDDLLSTTMHNYRNTLTDNVFDSRPGLNFFKEKGRVRYIDGGISIVEPLLVAEGESGSYTEWQQLTINPQQGISAAQFPWRQLYATIAISGLEEAQNNGKAAAINLLEAKVQQAEETLQNRLSGQIWGSIPGYNAAIDFGSLQALIDSTTPVGGIDPAADPANGFWSSVEVNATATPYTAASYEAALRNAYNTASDSGSDRIDALFGGQGTFEFYESTLTPQVRYTDTSKANLGFQNLLFKGVPFYWDFDVPAGMVFGINSKYVALVIHSQRNFAQTKFTSGLGDNVGPGHTAGVASTTGAGTSIDARYSFITLYGNMTIRNRRRNFKIWGISEAP